MTETVSLFIPCLVDQVYPEMGMAMVRVLEHLGYRVTYCPRQTCCGQPAFNAGHLPEARNVARHFLECFADEECIVGPSGSCTAMVRNYFGELFAGEPEEELARRVSQRVWEFSEFLRNEEKISAFHGRHFAKVAFHCSCHSLRELKLPPAVPDSLIRQVDGATLHNPETRHQCCGFGGLFTVKYPEISDAMTKVRLEQLLENGADTIVSNDPGCIMTLRRRAKELSLNVRILHLAEFLAESLPSTVSS